MKENYELSESDRQVIVLALAKLSLSRPGWHPACIGPIVDRLGGRWHYERYRLHGPDPDIAHGKKHRFRFKWHVGGNDHETAIEACDLGEACSQLYRLHGTTLGAVDLPDDFRIEIEATEVLG